MNEGTKIGAIFGIAIIAFASVAALPFILTALGQSETTGICIFKGPASYGLFSNSDGVPLRGIGVDAWHRGSFGVHTTDAAGPTDRLGCFTFKLLSGETDYLSYNYNGTSYIDSVNAGTVLRDNLP